jgi:hypothetical protein
MDEAALIARLTALENANNAKTDVESFWIVFDPSFVRVWCPKSECPNLGRKLEVETVTIKKGDATIVEDGQIVEISEEEKDEEVESLMVFDKGPRKDNHPLGIVAAFKTEREATKWTERYYRSNQRHFAEMDYPPALEILEVSLS